MTGLQARLPLFVRGSGDAATALAGACVAVVGAGSIGLQTILHLARLAIGRLGILDPACLKQESLCTHPVFPRDVGCGKADWGKSAVRRISPGTVVDVHPVPVERLGAAEFLRYDAVLLATDNLAAEIHVGNLCTQLGLPLIHAAVHGETLTAQVRHFANRDADGPCPACLYGPKEWAALNRNVRYSCGRAAPAVETAATPTMSVSALCSLAADVAVVQLLRSILKLGEPAGDQLVQYTGYMGRMTSGRIERRLSCPCTHRHYRRVPVRGDTLSGHTPTTLLYAAGICEPEGLARQALSVEGFRWVRRGLCACRPAHNHGGFVSDGAASTGKSCSTCGDAVRPDPFYSFPALLGADLQSRAETSLAQMGAGAARVVFLSDQENGVLIHADEEAADDCAP